MTTQGRRLTAEGLPQWLLPLAEVAANSTTDQLTRYAPPDEGGRMSAVLMLFGESADHGRDLLLIERAHDMTSHAGQPAFPGGALEPSDANATAAALREAQEETDLDPSGVAPFALYPDLFVPPSGFVVTPVLAWWSSASPVRAADPREVASVHRVALDDLINPANRGRARHPSGFVGPAFTVAGLVVWGFTAGLIDRTLALAGWEQDWDRERLVDLPLL